METDLEKKSLFNSDLKNLRNLSVDSPEFSLSSISYGSTFAKNLQRPLTVSWHNLIVQKLGDSKSRILDNVCGVAKSGQFVALMGSSGAGKTTLLNSLLSRNLKNLKVSGSVLVDGQELGKEITYVSGYVQQDELFMSTLTVCEHLMIQAQLRLVNYTNDQKKKRVSEIIKELGLKKCENVRIGNSLKKGISGGEMRRLSFASELLSNPTILFCDEPTTGLDSSMSESVVNLMLNLCKKNRTIICTIHQPSSIIYRKFDVVMFLAKGRVAYYGNPSKAVELLSRFGYPCPKNYNPADMIIEKLSIIPYNETACMQRIKSICDRFDESVEGLNFYNEVEKCRYYSGSLSEARCTASYFVQTKSLFYRSFLDNWRNPSLARAKFIQKFIMGIFIGLLYWQTSLTPLGIQNLTGGLFYIVAELTYSTLFVLLNFVPLDYPLLVREYHDGLYNVLCYYIAKCLSFIPLFTLDGWVMLTISYWMIGLVPKVKNFLMALGISFLIEQAASAFGIMLSSVCSSYIIAVSVAGPLITVLSLTGGFFANIAELPIYVSWIQYFSWFRYGFESLAILQWVGAAKMSHNDCVGTNSTNCLSAKTILDNYSFNSHNFYFDIVAMFVIIIFFYIIGFCGLYIRVHKSR